MEERNNDFPIKSVRKAMDILDILSAARRPLRIGEIAAATRMSASAVSRLVTTLARGALVHQDDETGRCYLGLGLMVLGANAVGRAALNQIAMPIMDELANRIRGSVGLSRLARGKAAIVRAQPSSQNHHGVSFTVVAPFHACAPGKMLATALSTDKILEMTANYGMDPITTFTITDPERFIAAVEGARADGFALDNQESCYNHRHVACPIFNHQGSVVATLSAGGALSDFPWQDVPALIHSLSHGCLRISRELGYVGDTHVNIEGFDANRYEASPIGIDQQSIS